MAENEGNQNEPEQIQIRPEFLLPAEQEARQKAEGENVMLRALVAQLRAELFTQASAIDALSASQAIAAAQQKVKPSKRSGGKK